VSPAVPHGLSGADDGKALMRGGFEHVSTRGSHAKYRADGRTVIVPLHAELAAGTLRSILRQAGWPVETLESLLK
jgi:predicted RNA binding protein YcfA (HicA-like mRNA interferase family)